MTEKRSERLKAQLTTEFTFVVYYFRFAKIRSLVNRQHCVQTVTMRMRHVCYCSGRGLSWEPRTIENERETNTLLLNGNEMFWWLNNGHRTVWCGAWEREREENAQRSDPFCVKYEYAVRNVFILVDSKIEFSNNAHNASVWSVEPFVCQHILKTYSNILFLSNYEKPHFFQPSRGSALNHSKN